MFESQTGIFFGYPLTVDESPVSDQHESSVRPKWNKFSICNSAMCQSKLLITKEIIVILYIDLTFCFLVSEKLLEIIVIRKEMVRELYNYLLLYLVVSNFLDSFTLIVHKTFVPVTNIRKNFT